MSGGSRLELKLIIYLIDDPERKETYLLVQLFFFQVPISIEYLLVPEWIYAFEFLESNMMLDYGLMGNLSDNVFLGWYH